MNRRFSFNLLFLFLLFVVGCDRVTEDPKGDEMARFDAWIKVNNITTPPTASGLYYLEERAGTGISPSDSDLVIYSYVERNLNDYIYKNTYKDTAKLYDIYGLYKTTTHYVPEVSMYFSKKAVPQGLAEGLGKMKEGGKSRLILPYYLAYGKNGSGSIVGYTSLIYDIELVKVFNGDFIDYEKDLVSQYLLENLGFTLISDSIYYKQISTIPIKGGVVVNGDSAKVDYIGRFIDDGFIFDTNVKSVAIDSNIYNPTKVYEPLEFLVGEKSTTMKPKKTPTPGFHLAVKQMTLGEKAIFVMLSKSMYGVDGNSSGATLIPPYTPLIFEVEVKEIVRKTR